jgi:hypothetical protein
MKEISIQPKIKCFISAKTLLSDRERKQNGLISFAIPDLGILFKERYLGSYYELEYISLLALLRFVELNYKAFQGQKLNVLCSSSLLVYQMNEDSFCQKEMERYRNLALAYKKKLKFSLSWVPHSENRALDELMHLPPLKNSFDFNFKDIHKKLF